MEGSFLFWILNFLQGKPFLDGQRCFTGRTVAPRQPGGDLLGHCVNGLGKTPAIVALLKQSAKVQHHGLNSRTSDFAAQFLIRAHYVFIIKLGVKYHVWCLRQPLFIILFANFYHDG